MALIGASPLGSAALDRLGLDYHLVVTETENPSVVTGTPRSIDRAPYDSDPISCLDLRPAAEVTAVVSFTESGLLAASMYGEAYGLSCVPLTAVLRSRHKGVMRAVLGTVPSGVLGAVPSGVLGTVPSGMVSGTPAGRPAEYPVIVKPATGTASQGVALVSGPAEFAALADRPGLIWERYYPGAEYSVETITRHGRHEVLGITRKVTTGPPHFVEIEHLAPAPLAAGQAASITAAVVECLDAIGLFCGPGHTELIWTGDRPVVVETHTRPGGDRIPRITELVSGRNQHLETIAALVGRELPAAEAGRHPVAGVRFFRWPAGRLTALGNLAAARQVPGVDEIEIDAAVQDVLTDPSCSAHRPGYVVAGADHWDELTERLDAAERHVRPEVAPLATRSESYPAPS